MESAFECDHVVISPDTCTYIAGIYIYCNSYVKSIAFYGELKSLLVPLC